MSHLRLHFAYFIFHLKGCVILGIGSALSALRNRINSTFGSTPPRNMTLNTSGHHISQPVKKFPTGQIAYYDPVVNSAVSKVTGSDKFNVTKNAMKAKGSRRSSGGSGYGGYSGSYSGGSYGGYSTPLSPASQAINYYEAPIAQQYGFSATTAYQEALANTAYRREMNDMIKAGLNPSVIYGSHSTSGADSNILPRDDFAYNDFGYGGSGGSGGSSGYRRRSRGGNSGKYVFSGGAYYGIMAAVGTITAATTKNVGAGMAAAGLTGTALKALNGFFKK